MKKLLLVSLLLLSLKSIAKDNIGCFHIDSSDAEYPKAMVITQDGNYVMGGGIKVSGGIINFYAVKTDPLGNILWSNVIGGNSNEYFNDLIEASDHIIAVKFDENGNLPWSNDINS